MSYISPIKLEFKDSLVDGIVEQIQNELGEYCYQRIMSVGVKVDKDELMKALEYDRGQNDYCSYGER